MSTATGRRLGSIKISDQRTALCDEKRPGFSPALHRIAIPVNKQTAIFSPAEQARLLAEDSLAWRTVCLELVAIVSAGALAMALIVAAVSL